MKYAYLSLIFVMAGIFGIAFIVLFQDITVNNESEYYVLKEAMEAAMLESVDITCYRAAIDKENNECGNGKVKISEQKFVENFTRRFSESVRGTATNYKLEFYDIMESPPKATVIIKSKTIKTGLFETKNGDGTFTIANNLSGILEYDYVLSGGTNIDEVESSSVDNNVNGSDETLIIDSNLQQFLPPAGNETSTNEDNSQSDSGSNMTQEEILNEQNKTIDDLINELYPPPESVEEETNTETENTEEETKSE